MIRNYDTFCFDTPQIFWENGYIGDNGSHCLVSVDATDFAILEPCPFDPKWFSHKINSAGLCYEIAICIQTGEPVWINGPFPCGDWPDLRIARNALVDALDAGEYYLADGGYKDGNQYSVTPTGLHNFDDRLKAVVHARRESLNKRYKDWGSLSQVYRHDRVSHSKVFRAVANIVQVTIMNGEPLFEVEYHD